MLLFLAQSGAKTSLIKMSYVVVQHVDNGEPSGDKVARWSRRFVLSSGCIFLVTGLAKVGSALGKAGILRNADPVFGISFGHLMLSVGIWELAVAGVCLFTRRRNLSLGLTAWMATNFLAYRAGLWFLGWQRPCSCLGNLTDALHIPPHAADVTMKIILLYLLAGSYGNLICLWKLGSRVHLNIKEEGA
jgi:hypothetical protein